jgi:hypothetical protein
MRRAIIAVADRSGKVKEGATEDISVGPVEEFVIDHTARQSR